MKRGVRQRDTISPKLFTLCLEDVFTACNWEQKGININGDILNHLRSADDILLVTHNLKDLQEMLTEINEKAKTVGLNINKEKL